MRFPYRWLPLALLLAGAPASAQFSTPAVDCSPGSDYGANTATVDGVTWSVTWDDTYLYVSVENARETDEAVLYLDLDPIRPINGGGNGDGSTIGVTFDGVTPNLPFRADAAVYARNDDRTVWRADGTGGWSLAVPAGASGLGGQASNDYDAGFYCSNQRGGGVSADDDRELRVAWSRLLDGGSRPASFAWLGYIQEVGDFYAQVPAGNPSGGTQPNLVRYFTVASTADGAATNPLGGTYESYTHLGDSVVGPPDGDGFGALSVWDFTMNSTGKSITRKNFGGEAWTVRNDLVVAGGELFFGQAGGSGYGATAAANVYVLGSGTLDLDYTDQPLVVTGRFQTFDTDGIDPGEPNVFLSRTPGGDIEVEGELQAYDESSVTTRPGGGLLRLTSTGDRIAAIAPPAAGAGTIAGASGVTNGDLRFERRYEGGDGWRLLASPLEGQTFETLNAPFHTQGAPCADNTAGATILYRFDPAFPSTEEDEEDRYRPVEEYCDPIAPGAGYLFYAFADAPNGGLPTDWVVQGTERVDDLDIELPGTGTGTPLRSAFNLAGNPYGGHLDWVEVLADSDQLSTTYHVWDPTANSGEGAFVSFTPGVDTHPEGAGRFIAPFQGFFVQATGATLLDPADLRFRQSQKNNLQDPNLFGRPAPLAHVRLTVEASGAVASAPATLVLSPEADPGDDPLDALHPGSLSATRVLLAMAEGERRLLVQGRPAPSEGPLALPLRFTTSEAGRHMLTWPEAPGVGDVRVEVLDARTGRTVLAGEPYAFESEPVDEDDRFTLVLTPAAVVATEGEAPEGMEVGPVAPNPAAAAARVAIRTGRGGALTAAVYDALGRRVLVLHEGEVAPEASMALTVPAGRLAPGAYVLRVHGAAASAARPFTVVR